MKKCPYCAEEIQDEAILCKFCKSDLSFVPQKNQKSLENIPHQTQSSTYQSASTTCPKCNQADRIIKVSSLVAEGISSGSYQGPTLGVSTPIGKGQSSVSGGFTRLNGSSQTLLSQLLEPPAKPEITRFSGCSIWAIVGLSILLIMAIIGYGEGGAAFAFFLPVIIIGVIVIQNDKVKSSKEKYQVQLPRWENAIYRWNKLYYCGRDGGVFDPDENVFVPLGDMMDYLYVNGLPSGEQDPSKELGKLNTSGNLEKPKKISSAVLWSSAVLVIIGLLSLFIYIPYLPSYPSIFAGLILLVFGALYKR